jgi:hypothetical protein
MKKLITVNNLHLQFDVMDKCNVSEDGIKRYVDELNNVLSIHLPETDPRLVITVDSKIKIIDPLL